MSKRIFPFFTASFVGLTLGVMLLSTDSVSHICPWQIPNDFSEISCSSIWIRAGEALLYGAGALSLIFLVLLLVPKAFPAWKRFAIWFVPLAALIFIFYPEPHGGDILSPTSEMVFQWVSAFYVIVSLLIIGISSSRVRTENK